MVVVGSSDDLRESLFGTAAGNSQQTQETRSKDVVYYLVDLSTAQDWLAEKYPDTSEELGQAVDLIASISKSPKITKEVQNAQEAVDLVLPHMYAALTNVENPAEVKVSPDSTISDCLALDDDPVKLEPELYLYLTIPAAQAKEAGVPQEWQTLKEPKTNALYWTLLACFPEPEAVAD
jgi:hypothetical protein